MRNLIWGYHAHLNGAFLTGNKEERKDDLVVRNRDAWTMSKEEERKDDLVLRIHDAWTMSRKCPKKRKNKILAYVLTFASKNNASNKKKRWYKFPSLQSKS